MFNHLAYIGKDEPISIYIPDTVLNHSPKYRYRWLRGYSHVLAVFEGDECIGWTLKDHLEINQVLPPIP